MIKHSKSCACSLSQNALQPELNVRSEVQSRMSHLSVFHVSKMDCPSEEQLIRAAFACFDKNLIFEFDLPGRKVRIYHPNMADKVEKAIKSVGLGATLVSLKAVDQNEGQAAQKLRSINDAREAQVLRLLLVINAVMFVLELTAGITAQSTGLIADSLDMLADATVYGVSLYAVGKVTKIKLNAAHFSGWLQIILALGVLLEVARRYLYGSEPVSALMMGFGTIALIANIICLLLIFKWRNQGSHMKASWIFSTNDVLANIGVIAAGLLVAWTGSRFPDLIIGLIVGGFVLSGAVRILSLKQ